MRWLASIAVVLALASATECSLLSPQYECSLTEAECAVAERLGWGFLSQSEVGHAEGEPQIVSIGAFMHSCPPGAECPFVEGGALVSFRYPTGSLAHVGVCVDNAVCTSRPYLAWFEPAER
jgi:hypothetical protein